MFQLFLYLICLTACVTVQATTLKFCYESKELLPHYRGEGVLTPSEKPGAAIEIVQKLDEMLSKVQIEFVREPWKRCLNDLKLGKVDALIARHSVSRESFAKYPKTTKNELDNERAISSTATCLIHKKNVPLKWDGNQLLADLPQGISVPRGYSLVEDLKKKGFQIYETASVKQAHELLFKGRVGISLSDCEHKELPSGYVENKEPLVENYGYLVFSHQFYSLYPNLAEDLWNQLMRIDDKVFYSKY
jgi:polar amino acid transport system substrate-binding protein